MKGSTRFWPWPAMRDFYSFCSGIHGLYFDCWALWDWANYIKEKDFFPHIYKFKSKIHLNSSSVCSYLKFLAMEKMMKAVGLFSSPDNWECQCFWWASVCHSRPNLICPKQWMGREKKWGNPTCHTVGWNPLVMLNDVWVLWNVFSTSAIFLHSALLVWGAEQLQVVWGALQWAACVLSCCGVQTGQDQPPGLCLCSVTHWTSTTS